MADEVVALVPTSATCNAAVRCEEGCQFNEVVEHPPPVVHGGNKPSNNTPGVASGNAPGGERSTAATGSWDGTSHRVDLGKESTDYGTPVEGSLTDKRGKKAGAQISNEVVELCQIIHSLGHRLPGPQWAIHFGVLFDFYTKISNKLVGMLMRARKHGLIKFEGEMLFQRQDDHVVIYLVSVPAALKEHVAQKDGLPIEIIP